MTGHSTTDAENDLVRWKVQYNRRDELVIGAAASGLSKHRIHLLTGLARTTIDRILVEGSPEQHEGGTRGIT